MLKILFGATTKTYFQYWLLSSGKVILFDIEEEKNPTYLTHK